MAVTNCESMRSFHYGVTQVQFYVIIVFHILLIFALGAGFEPATPMALAN